MKLSMKMRLASWFAILIVMSHFSMTILFLAPKNPISLEYSSYINRYMTPFFQQNWQLFAPNPINAERAVLIRARMQHPDYTYTITDFHDITSPYVDDIQRYRIFAPLRTRIILNSIQLLTFTDPSAQQFRDRLEEIFVEQVEENVDIEDLVPELFPLTDYEQDVIKLAVKILYRLAVRSAIERWGDNISDIQIRFAVHRFPRFSERQSNSKTGEVVTEDFDWLPILEA